MYSRSLRRLAHVIAVALIPIASARSLAAQAATEPPPHDHAAMLKEQAGEHQHEGHDMSHMSHGSSASPADRQGSGTSWLPDETPMYAVHATLGEWALMTHGSAFLQYLHEGGDRGSEQTGSINWIMLMATRSGAAGRLQLSGMVSAEPGTIGGCGYPDLLATGELCDGDSIHDRQHPHDLFMELSAKYDRSLGRGVSLQLYGAPVGEPALGPVAFMHRVSALANPIAPITHHWFDSTHITYGVATAGLYGQRWKAETSVFNGREPDEDRTDFDFGAMDSWSARLWFLPTKQWALQLSGGRLKEAEAPDEAGEPRTDVDRVTASATYHRSFGEGSIWASTIGWGRNAEAGHDATNALLVESGVTLHDRDSVYGRFELGSKSSHDLVVPGDELFTVSKLQAGYTRYLANLGGLKPGVGVAASAAIVPDGLRSAYGGRVNGGVAVYLTLRPAAIGE